MRRGTVHAIVGENGAGKSTLMKILYGVQRPDEGTIAVNGALVQLQSPADAIGVGIGMVFQHFMLADNFTVLENVVLGAEKLHGIGAAARAEIRRISLEYGLEVEPDDLVADLGVGTEAARRLEVIVADSLGQGWREAGDLRLSLEHARRSLRFYRGEDVPTIPQPVPPAVRDVRFVADLSDIVPVASPVVRALAPALAPLLPASDTASG